MDAFSETDSFLRGVFLNRCNVLYQVDDIIFSRFEIFRYGNRVSVRMESAIDQLLKLGALKFGEFVLKSGQKSSVYCDLRILVSHPEILASITDQLWQKFVPGKLGLDRICGVPYTALPVATHLSIKHSIPMIMRRKEVKDYGTKKLLEGDFCKGERCLIVEDVVTTGGSVIETAEVLREQGLVVDKVIVFVDREQGAKEKLKQAGIEVISLISMTDILERVRSSGDYSSSEITRIESLVQNGHANGTSHMNGDAPPCKVPKIVTTFIDRIETAKCEKNKSLLETIRSKKTNVCLSIDVVKCSEVLETLDQLGPHICLAKTHVDILEDIIEFGVSKFSERLKSLSKKHNFLIMEDRKFSDIGNTFAMQLFQGPFRIVQWADFVTAHAVSGPGMLETLKKKRDSNCPAVVFVAEMSSSGNFITPDYSQKTLKLGRKFPDLVSGFVYRNHDVISDDAFVRFMPGVSLETSTDGGDQSYVTVEKAVGEEKCDVIIVGRAILKSEDRIATVETLKSRAWQCFRERYSFD